LYYARVKDDILIIARYESGFLQRTKEGFQRLASDFVIDKREASTAGVAEYFWSLGVPLGPESRGHPGFVARGWMASEARRFARRSSSHDNFLLARGVFVESLRNSFISSSLITRVREYDPCVTALCETTYTRSANSGGAEAPRDLHDVLRIISPYHPVWYAADIARVIDRLLQSELWRGII